MNELERPIATAAQLTLAAELSTSALRYERTLGRATTSVAYRCIANVGQLGLEPIALPSPTRLATDLI